MLKDNIINQVLRGEFLIKDSKIEDIFIEEFGEDEMMMLKATEEFSDLEVNLIDALKKKIMNLWKI